MTSIVCPVCQNVSGNRCASWPTQGDTDGINCEVCGPFEMSRTAVVILSANSGRYSPVQRAALSHLIRESGSQAENPPLITTNWLEKYGETLRLPSPAIQVANTIRFIGDHIVKTGNSVGRLQPYIYSVMGAPNSRMAGALAFQMRDKGLLEGFEIKTMNAPPDLMNVNLTLDGWERYEAEKKGKVSSTYGFIAMQFGDQILDDFVKDVIKPCIKRELTLDLVDMRDVAQAGIIDNIMRTRIRDAAFVIVDLTHDNSGAYWEAGYAEGLGKPVVYICERNKFEEKRTHFDTNHCTTVPWLSDSASTFEAELVSTLRRSLNLFST